MQLKPSFHMICNGLRSVCDTIVMVGKVESSSTFPTITTVSQTVADHMETRHNETTGTSLPDDILGSGDCTHGMRKGVNTM